MEYENDTMQEQVTPAEEKPAQALHTALTAVSAKKAAPRLDTPAETAVSAV